MLKTLRSPRHRAIVDALVECRESAGLTQTELAKRLGRSQSIVAALKAGGRRIDLVELLDLADILKFDIHKLVDRVVAAG
jgi:transcriptional regulator with XRE-family HTH domain